MKEMNLNKKKWFAAIVFCWSFLALTGSLPQAQVNKNKTTTLGGKIYRSDKNQSLSGVTISLGSSQGNRLETKTDAKGNYSFDQVRAGKYRIMISARYNKISDVPCNIGTGATADKNSYVNMKDEGLGYVDVWVYIDPFTISTGKPVTKDFDVTCKGFMKNRPKR